MTAAAINKIKIYEFDREDKSKIILKILSRYPLISKKFLIIFLHFTSKDGEKISIFKKLEYFIKNLFYTKYIFFFIDIT